MNVYIQILFENFDIFVQFVKCAQLLLLKRNIKLRKNTVIKVIFSNNAETPSSLWISSLIFKSLHFILYLQGNISNVEEPGAENSYSVASDGKKLETGNRCIAISKL